MQLVLWPVNGSAAMVEGNYGSLSGVSRVCADNDDVRKLNHVY